MKANTIMISMTAAAVMASSCQKCMEDVAAIADGGAGPLDEILIEIHSETSVIDFENDTAAAERTKSSAMGRDSLQATDTSAFLVTHAPMGQGDDVQTKASAVTTLPATLKWLATTGTAGNRSVRWGPADVSVSDGKLATGQYQTQTPTVYSHYVSNSGMNLTASGVTISVSDTRTSDIIAGAVTTASASPAVTLSHILARTGSVTVNPPAGCTVEGVSVTLKAAAGGGSSGTYNMDSATWSGVTGLSSATTLTGSSDMYLVPGQYSISASFTIRNGSWTKAVTRSGTISLKAGCINNITVNSTPVITHEVAVTPGTTGTIYPGGTRAFTATYHTLTNGVRDSGTDVTSSASWSSSNTGVATMGGSTATAKAAGTATISATYSGTTGSTEFTVSANSITSTWYEYSKPWFNLGGIADIPASGGTSAAPSISNVGQQRRTATKWSNGTMTYSGWENITPTYSARYSQTNANFSTTHTGFSAGSLGTSVRDRTKIGTMYVILLVNGVYSDTQYKDVYQAANAITSYGAITISQFSYATPAWNSTAYVTPTLAYSQAVTYTSGSTASTVSGLTRTFSHSNGSEFTLDPGTGGVRVNSIPSTTVYNAPVITNFKLSPDPVAAKGGMATPSFSYSQALRRDIPVRTDAVTVTVAGNGKTATRTATRTQAGNTGVISTTQASHNGATFSSSAFSAEFSAVGSVSGFTVSKSGTMLTIRWIGHNHPYSKSAQVRMNFTMNGKTTSAYATSTQSAAEATSGGGGTSYTVSIDKTQLYVRRSIMYGNGNSITNDMNDKFTVKCNGADVTASCTKTGYSSSVISVDSNGTVHYSSDGETAIKVSYKDAGGTTHTFDVHVRSEFIEEYE